MLENEKQLRNNDFKSFFFHVDCSLGVFHELAVAIFIVSIGDAVCVQVRFWRQISNI